MLTNLGLTQRDTEILSELPDGTDILYADADSRDAEVMRVAQARRIDRIGYAALRVGIIDAGGRKPRDWLDVPLVR